MKILKRENWWAWLLLLLFSNSSAYLVLGALVDCYDKDAWYAKPKNWIIAFALFIFPGFVMMSVFFIQILCQTAARLNVSGKEVYLSPYVWIVSLIVPVIGWILFLVMTLYLEIFILVELYRGSGEKYIK